jgi:hypothetical protein
MIKNKTLLSITSVLFLTTLTACNECKDCKRSGSLSPEKKCGDELKKLEADSLYTCD